jgi:putative transposase
MNMRRTSHSVYETSYHLVWCPKYRRDIFKPSEIRKRAKELIRAICEEYGFEVEELEVSMDHVHIMLSIPPSRAIGYAIRVIKSISARELFREFPELKQRLWSGQLWEDGYFARTVGSRMTSEVIKKYIKHHKELEQEPTQLRMKL